jgi:hypothetical protein
MACLHKAADKMGITIRLKLFGVKTINKFVVTSNKLTNHFAELVTSGLRQEVARGPSVSPR